MKVEIETLRETSAAMEKYIYAIPALCRGEEVPCALHVSLPIKELRSEIERLKAGGWQPIETAPKITDVLCLLESGRASVMYLTDNGQGFMDNWRNPDGTASGHWPTHWMPLPQPPQGETI